MEQVLSQKGRVAVITGGASGIGKATAHLFARYGAQVCLVDVNAAKGMQAAGEIGEAARFFLCDITREAAVAALAREIDEKLGRVDVLFNNAGVIVRESAPNLAEAGWNAVVDVTLKGAFHMCKFFIPIMKRGGGGSIVNTGSGWGLKGGDRAVAYCAAKGGIVNMTRALAIDHGPDNIRVNCVCPGDTATPLLSDEGRQLGIDNEADFFAQAAQGRPLARIGQPEDVAGAVLFFCSPLAGWVTGTALPVDGGGIA